MGNNIINFIFIIILSGCAMAYKAKQSGPPDENKMRRQFLHILHLKDLDRAAPYVVYFKESQLEADQALLVQFYILACSPVQAYEHLRKMKKNSKMKKKLETTLAALVTTGLKNEDFVEKKEKRKDIVRYSVDSQEVWKDEWRFVRAKLGSCKQFPQLGKEKKKQYTKVARNMFTTMGNDFLLNDFSLVALAIELKIDITGKKEILSKFKEYSDSTYYKRLESDKKNRKVVTRKIKARVVSDNQIHIKGMNFYKKIRPKNSWLPMVLNEKDFRKL